jgi:hypothetical protein
MKSADQVAGRLERLDAWWDKVSSGDPSAVPDLAGADEKRRQEFCRLFRGDTARRVRDGIIARIAGNNPVEVLAITEQADQKELELREDHPTRLEGLLVQEVVTLMLAAHETDLQAQAVDESYTFKQGAYHDKRRLVTRKMLNAAINLLGSVHYRLAKAEAVANPPINDWRYSDRIGSYRHSRN